MNLNWIECKLVTWYIAITCIHLACLVSFHWGVGASLTLQHCIICTVLPVYKWYYSVQVCNNKIAYNKQSHCPLVGSPALPDAITDFLGASHMIILPLGESTVSSVLSVTSLHSSGEWGSPCLTLSQMTDTSQSTHTQLMAAMSMWVVDRNLLRLNSHLEWENKM